MAITLASFRRQENDTKEASQIVEVKGLLGASVLASDPGALSLIPSNTTFRIYPSGTKSSLIKMGRIPKISVSR